MALKWGASQALDAGASLSSPSPCAAAPRKASQVRAWLEALADPERARGQLRFFRTGPGEYGEGDVFWGVSVPQIRAVVKASQALPLEEAERLIRDEIHEVRACGLLILVEKSRKASEAERQALVDVYLRLTAFINNWDLVDMSCSLVGEWLVGRDRGVLYQLAASSNLWEQRIAVVSTLSLIRRHDFADTLRLAELLLHHPHDLIHKALGWMLREVGKRNTLVLTEFLSSHAARMPRTTLRYAIERFPPAERRQWLRLGKGPC